VPDEAQPAPSKAQPAQCIHLLASSIGNLRGEVYHAIAFGPAHRKSTDVPLRGQLRASVRLQGQSPAVVPRRNPPGRVRGTRGMAVFEATARSSMRRPCVLDGVTASIVAVGNVDRWWQDRCTIDAHGFEHQTRGGTSRHLPSVRPLERTTCSPACLPRTRWSTPPDPGSADGGFRRRGLQSGWRPCASEPVLGRQDIPSAANAAFTKGRATIRS
jgi:hypothetical protein